MRVLQPANPLMHGPDVRELQELLIAKGFVPLVADGWYGPETQKRVLEAKRALHYKPENVKPTAGDDFRKRLLGYSPSQSTLQLPAVFRPTHDTGGLPNFPAIDLFAKPGTLALAPESGRLVFSHFITWDKVKRVGGWTVYLQARSGDTYFLTHFSWLTKLTHCGRGQVIGAVAPVPGKWWEPHIHEGKHHGFYDPLA